MGDNEVTFSLIRSADDIPECLPVDKQLVQACVLSSTYLAPLDGGGANVTNVEDIITIIDIIANLCGGFPIALASNFCIDLAPGFCSSIVQNINGAWGIYRAPGMTEITVGNSSGGVGGAPGANFSSVTAALGAPATPTNCRFLRITDDTIDGNITLPANTLIYIDPGVTWTVTGQITMSGDFVLLGANSIPSSRLIYGGNALPFIIGSGSLFVANLHLDRSVAPSVPGEVFVIPSIPTRFINTVVDVHDADQGFLSDTSGAFANMTLDDVVINGAGATNAIFIQNVASIFRSSSLVFQGTFSVAITCGNGTAPEWNGIRHQATSASYVLGGTISDFQDLTQTADVTVASSAQISNMSFTNLRFLAATTRVNITNAHGQITDFSTLPPNLQLTDFVTNTVLNDSFTPGTNSRFTNFRIESATTPVISSLNIALGQWQNIYLGASWTATTTGAGALANSPIMITDLQVNGNLSLAVDGLPVAPVAPFFLKNVQCNDFTLGNAGIADNCNFMISGLRATGNGNFSLSRNATQGVCTDFEITGDLTITQMFGEALFKNGKIGGNFSNTAVQAIRQKYENIEIVGNFNNVAADCHFQNLLVGGSFTLSATANANTVTGLSTLRVPGVVPSGGLVSITGNSNVLTQFNLVGNSVNIAGNGNTCTNWQVQGGSTAGAQTFTITGTNQKLSNIMLGCPVSQNTNDFTLFGFGSSSDGAFTVNFGNPANNQTRGLQIDNFSVYPKRGQTIVAGVGDITGAIAAPANRIINISTVGSAFNNCHFWFYPGGLSTSAAVLIPHIAPTTNVNVTSFTSQCQFQNMIIGFGQETPGATALTSLGGLTVTGAGSANFFQNCTTVTFTNAHTDTQYCGCNGFAFASLTPPTFTTTGLRTTINDCIFNTVNIQAANCSLNNSVTNTTTLNGASTGSVVTRNRFITAFTIAPAPLAPLPLVVGNIGTGAVIPVNANAASIGNY